MTPAGAYIVWAALAGVAVATVAARRRAIGWWPAMALAAVAALSVAAFAFVSWGRATPFGDFNKAYYPAGRLVFENPAQLYACDAGTLCFVNIPIVAALFAPLSAMERTAAQVAFSAIGAVATVASVWLLAGELKADRVERYTIVALVVLNGPLLYSVRLGNLTHVMLPFLVAAGSALTRGRDARAGALFGALAIIKPPLLLVLPYLAIRGRWRAATMFTIIVAAVATASILWFGLEPHRAWLTQIAGPFSSRPVAAYNVQSISGMLAHFERPDHLADWTPLDMPAAFRLVVSAMVALVVGAAAAACLIGGAPLTTRAQWTELSMVLVLILLVSPLTWTHYYAFCLLPLACYATGAVPAPNASVRWALAAAAVLISAPVVLWLPDIPVLGSLVARVLVSHYVGGALLLLAALCASRVAQRETAAVSPDTAQFSFHTPARPA